MLPFHVQLAWFSRSTLVWYFTFHWPRTLHSTVVVLYFRRPVSSW